MAARLVLATSSSKALSRKTTVVSARGFELLVPLGNTEGQRLDFFPNDLLVKANDQCSGTNGAHGLARDGPGLDWDAEVKTKLEQQFVEDVVFATIRLDVVNAVEKRFFQIIAVRFPGTDVGGVEFEDTKTEVACEHRGPVFYLLGGATKTLFCEFSDVTWLAEFVAEVGLRFSGRRSLDQAVLATGTNIYLRRSPYIALFATTACAADPDPAKKSRTMSVPFAFETDMTPDNNSIGFGLLNTFFSEKSSVRVALPPWLCPNWS